MIARDNVKFLKNILSIDNPNINYDLLEKILMAIAHEHDLEKDILDSFSPNQFKSKLNLLNHIDDLKILNKDSEVVIMGSWYGSILISYLHDKVKKITCIDLDERTLQVAKTYFFPESDKIEWIAGDLFEDWKTHIYPKADLFINTSCEHMKPMKEWGPHPAYKTPWWTRVKKNAHFAFQSNNMYGLKGHINCVKKIEDFKQQLPEQFNILVEDEVVETRGTRFTLIGNARTT